MRKREIFDTIQREWKPDEKPSMPFIEAMNGLLELIEQDNIKNPHEILFNNFDALEQKIIDVIRESKDQLHVKADE